MTSPKNWYGTWYERNSEHYVVLTLRQFARDRYLIICGGGLLAIALAAVFAPYITPFPPNLFHVDNVLTPPNRQFLFGTDNFGRDILSRVIFGSRVSFFVGLVAVGTGVALGVPLGMVSGYNGGKVDSVIMRVVDALMAFPSILLVLALMVLFGTGVFTLMFGLGIATMAGYARMIRGNILKTKQLQYVEAARSVGYSDLHILVRHIMPNVAAPTIVQAGYNFGLAIIAEATFSFIGLGIQPPTASWGSMLFEGESYYTTAPWVDLFPGLAILITVILLNLFADRIRDALDPRLRQA